MKRGRVLWSPILAGSALAVWTTTTALTGLTAWRIGALVVHVAWLSLAIYDWRSGGALRRRLYSDGE